ncbi:MAG: hypothetical protein H6835_00085 [Planctomycetes bacterium]|nr:hypothetical protein [Planctomycetota bacterium]
MFSLAERCDPVALVDHLLLVTRCEGQHVAELVGLVVASVRGVVEIEPASLATLQSGGAFPIEGITWEGAFVRLLRPERMQ